MARDREMDPFEVDMESQAKGESLVDRPLCQDRPASGSGCCRSVALSEIRIAIRPIANTVAPAVHQGSRPIITRPSGGRSRSPPGSSSLVVCEQLLPVSEPVKDSTQIKGFAVGVRRGCSRACRSKPKLSPAAPIRISL